MTNDGSGWQPSKVHPSAYIHKTAVIYENVTIDADVVIGAYCIIGAPPEYRGRESNMMGVHIGKGTRITGLVTIDSGSEKKTYIGENCYIMKHAHVGHDAHVGDGVTLSCGVKIGGHCVIEDDVNIGLNAVIHQKVTIPAGCMIGASAFVGVKAQLQRGHKYAGVPVRMLGLNVKYAGANTVKDDAFDVAVYGASLMHNFTHSEVEAFTQGANFAKNWIEQKNKK